MNLFYTAYAKADLASSFTWYETQRKGLGFDFLDCVEIAIKAIIYRVHYSLPRIVSKNTPKFSQENNQKVSFLNLLYN